MKLFPLHVNPCYSFAVVLVLAYVPHILKRSYLEKKLKENNKKYTTANSRGLSAMMIDDSPLGMKIANLAGCHQNGLEAFGYYTAAMLTCMYAGVDRAALSGTAGLFIVIRLAYTYVYMGSLNGKPRTYLFFASGFLCIGLFVVAGMKYDAK